MHTMFMGWHVDICVPLIRANAEAQIKVDSQLVNSYTKGIKEVT